MLTCFTFGFGPLLRAGRVEHSKLSLRKEVIQPQVPLRLPCYDLVPVTEPGVDITVV
jgi:hypothetical protein